VSSVNSQFIITTSIVLIGYLIKRFNIINERDGEILTKLVLNVTLPALVISSASSLEFNPSLGLMPLIAVLYGLFMALLSLFLFKKQSGMSKGILSMLLPGFSVGLFAFPFVEGIWGKKALNYTAMFDMGNSLVTFVIIYFIAFYFSSENSRFDFRSITKKIFSSIPLIVYMLTLISSITGLRFPSIIVDISHAVGKANMPISMLALGIFLNFKMDSSNWRNIIKVLAARYLIGLTLGILQFHTLPLDLIIRKIILICLILPPPMSTLAFTVHFKYDKRFAGMTINVANIVSYVLMWIIFNIISSFQ
jgi:predicted permease